MTNTTGTKMVCFFKAKYEGSINCVSIAFSFTTITHLGTMKYKFPFAYCFLFPSANKILRGRHITAFCFTWVTGLWNKGNLLLLSLRTGFGQDLFITRDM